jgi:hypothetical protein
MAHEDVLLELLGFLLGDTHIAQGAETCGDTLNAPSLLDPSIDQLSRAYESFLRFSR